MRNCQSSYTFSSSSRISSEGVGKEAYIINVSSSNPSLKFNYSPSLNINPKDDQNNNLDLIKTILGFALGAALALLYGVVSTTSPTPSGKYLEMFIMFLLVAFCTTLAVTVTVGASQNQGQRKMVVAFQCISVISVALAVASVASIFLRSWFRVAAYGLCMVPLYALAQTQCEHLLGQLMVKLRAKLMKQRTHNTDVEVVVVGA